MDIYPLSLLPSDSYFSIVVAFEVFLIFRAWKRGWRWNALSDIAGPFFVAFFTIEICSFFNWESIPVWIDEHWITYGIIMHSVIMALLITANLSFPDKEDADKKEEDNANKCSECNGRGDHDCKTCNGTGTLAGTDDKRNNCADCKGRGKFTCSTCNGTGLEPVQQVDSTKKS